MAFSLRHWNTVVSRLVAALIVAGWVSACTARENGLLCPAEKGLHVAKVTKGRDGSADVYWGHD